MDFAALPVFQRDAHIAFAAVVFGHVVLIVQQFQVNLFRTVGGGNDAVGHQTYRLGFVDGIVHTGLYDYPEI